MSEEKNQKPTKKKLDDTREKGQVPVSRDLARVIGLIVVMESLFMTEHLWRDAIESLMRQSLASFGRPFATALADTLHSMGLFGAAVIASTVLLVVTSAIASYWGQFGLLIAPQLLLPSLEKLDPTHGVKQYFSKKKLVELLMGIVKSGLAALLTYILLRDQLAAILKLAGGTPSDIYAGFVELVHRAFHIIIVPFLILALADLAVQRYLHVKSLMMDLQEIRQEYKELEGDPLIKNKRKEIARELANQQGEADKTKNANAVVVNPTHFAVAMLYDESTPVPIVLAKGMDEVAQAMIASARKAGIPVIRHVWLARTLFATCHEDSPVPKASYEAVAHVYAVVLELYDNNATDCPVELESEGESPFFAAD